MDDTKNSTAPASEAVNIPLQDEAIEKYPSHAKEAKPVEAPTSIASTLQSFTDTTLNFLSHASNETLGACLVGFGATTYFFLGRVGLVIIGVAGGVVLHATWDGIRSDTRDEATKKVEAERRREAGIEVARRVLEWRTSRADPKTTEDLRVYANQALDYSGFGPETEAALNIFTDAVIKDYVHYWYDATIPGDLSFPASCRRTFTAFVLSLSAHLQRKRPAGAFLDFVTHATSMIIVFLQELAAALNASPNATPEEAVQAYLKSEPDSHLAYILKHESQKTKLGDIAEDILQAYLDPKSYNCPPVYTFLKEVLAQLVLGYTVDYCSQPAWINDWIVYGLEESETTKEVMDIVDAGVEGREKVSTPNVDAQVGQRQEAEGSVKSPPSDARSISRLTSNTNENTQHRRKVSKAEEAMDEAMREARRLTELMIAEDERRARAGQATPPNAGDSSDGATQGTPTPTSSQSDRDRQTEDTASVISESVETGEEKPITPSAPFTSFDQLIPQKLPTALSDSPQREAHSPQPAQRPILTLLYSKIQMFGDGAPGERVTIKAKPTTDYLIQIEPASSAYSGWMIVRKYHDFETLHEVLRRISVITGVRFAEIHPELPKWRVHTKASLTTELERYLSDAVQHQPLAESEGMKRFLEKDQGLSKSPSGSSKGLGWPNPDAFNKLGGDMMNVLTKAPKQVGGGVAAGGKAVFGGVAGLVGGVGAGKRASTSQANLTRSTTSSSLESTAARNRSSVQISGTPSMTDSYPGSMDSAGRQSQESLRAPPQSLERRSSSYSTNSFESSKSPKPAVVASSRPESIISQPELGLTFETTPEASASQPSLDEAVINLPPPPAEMPPDYNAPISPTRNSIERHPQMSRVETSAPNTPPRAQRPQVDTKQEPLTEEETIQSVELMFAVITQLYTLSGAWQIRRTLLGAAKAYLLRPGNQQLATIRDLLQTSLLDSNFNDSGLAHHIYELRKNTLPTAEEMDAWKLDYPEKTDEQKEELRAKARKLLVTKGMPQALTSVMGAAASGEALGKVFDCLQVPEISRGLIFGLMLQALRIVTH